MDRQTDRAVTLNYRNALTLLLKALKSKLSIHYNNTGRLSQLTLYIRRCHNVLRGSTLTFTCLSIWYLSFSSRGRSLSNTTRCSTKRSDKYTKLYDAFLAWKLICHTLKIRKVQTYNSQIICMYSSCAKWRQKLEQQFLQAQSLFVK